MGLDSVELLLAIEEEFGLDIPDEDAECMTTVDDVYQWLKLRIASADPIACLSQRVFYKLRRALIENYRLERRAITPDTRLTDLLPLNEVAEGWPFLQMFIELKTPSFKVANEYFGYRLTDQSLTIRELVETLIAINGRRLAPQRDSEEEIWRRLVRVFVRQTNVMEEEVVPSARIGQDLGID
jgi:hypothetical protein